MTSICLRMHIISHYFVVICLVRDARTKEQDDIDVYTHTAQVMRYVGSVRSVVAEDRLSE